MKKIDLYSKEQLDEKFKEYQEKFSGRMQPWGFIAWVEDQPEPKRAS